MTLFKAFGLLAVLITTLTTSQAAPAKRLIDTGNGHARWVSEVEADQLLAKAHASKRCGGYFDLTNFKPSQTKINQTVLPLVENFTLALPDRPLTQQNFLASAIPALDSARIIETVKTLAAFKNRYYQSPYGVQAAQMIAEQFTKLGKNRSDVKVELFKHSFKQPSVIATIAGQGPHASEIVVIGGHEDSINVSSVFGSSEQVAPGADDNATGVATVLEVFRVIIETGFKPDRTLAFMTYAGEEKGLLGSQDIANQFKRDHKNVVAVAQFDMTGFDGSGDQVVFMSDFTNPELTKYSQKLMDTYVKSRWSMDACGYACSDHASWNRAGYPAIMPFEATLNDDNKNIHTKNDIITLLDFTHSLHFTKLALAFAVELSAK
ncbi:MAG: M20/M25/M40 family metallo-hydrolase [Bdellovibrionales bacterium]|nr:M20/M25/M40 family metallo-hydrolase [Oligoflexia bacterium]